MAEVTQEAVGEAMFELVTEYSGKKKLKPMDLIKAMREKFEGADKKLCQGALKGLIDSGRVVYTYFGASYVELPPEEGTER